MDFGGGLAYLPRHPQIPRGREESAPGAGKGRDFRRRRNRPPETLRQKGRVGEGPLESPRPQGFGTDGVRP